MKHFFKGLIIFTIPLIIIFYTLDYLVTKGLRKTQYSQFSDWNDIFNGTINADIIINGSSRATVHVSPKIIDSMLNQNSYNLGIQGHQIYMELAKYNVYLSFNKTPKIIIHSIETFTLTKGKDLYGLTQFIPYIHNPIIKEATKQFNGFKNIDYILPLFRYRAVPGICKIGLMEYFKIKHYTNTTYKGYSGQDLTWTSDFDDFKKNNSEGYDLILDSASIKLFDNYLSECSKKKIKVFLVFSPEYIEGQKLLKNRKEIINLYKNLADKYNFVFLDYSNDSISLNRDYFYNSEHLNKNGSEIFTKKLTIDMKKWL